MMQHIVRSIVLSDATMRCVPSNKQILYTYFPPQEIIRTVTRGIEINPFVPLVECAFNDKGSIRGIIHVEREEMDSERKVTAEQRWRRTC